MRVRWRVVHRVEFTIEPFVEGLPGPHVTAPIEAVQSMNFSVDVGPFGSGCTVPADRSADVVATVVREAFANGATHVNIDVSTPDEEMGP